MNKFESGPLSQPRLSLTRFVHLSPCVHVRYSRGPMFHSIDSSQVRNQFLRRVAARLSDRAGGGPVEIQNRVVEWEVVSL